MAYCTRQVQIQVSREKYVQYLNHDSSIALINKKTEENTSPSILFLMFQLRSDIGGLRRWPGDDLLWKGGSHVGSGGVQGKPDQRLLLPPLLLQLVSS